MSLHPGQSRVYAASTYIIIILYIYIYIYSCDMQEKGPLSPAYINLTLTIVLSTTGCTIYYHTDAIEILGM